MQKKRKRNTKVELDWSIKTMIAIAVVAIVILLDSLK